MNLDRQIRYFEMQQDRSPDARFWLPLADLHLRNGDPTRALGLLDDHDAAARLSPSARWVRARAQARAGDFEDARTTLAAVLELDPGHRGAPTLLREIDDAEKARHEATLAVAAPADEEPELDDDVIVAVEPNPVEEPVVEEPEPVLVAGPSPSEDRPDDEAAPRVFQTRTLADIYLAQGHKDKALEILYKVLADHPEREDVVAQIAAVESGARDEAEVPAAADPAPPADRDDANRRRFEEWLVREREAGGEA